VAPGQRHGQSQGLLQGAGQSQCQSLLQGPAQLQCLGRLRVVAAGGAALDHVRLLAHQRGSAAAAAAGAGAGRAAGMDDKCL
jgi:hypothetical protein